MSLIMKPSSRNSRISRRNFLRATGAAIGGPMIVPSTVFGQAGRAVPSERIVIGIVGWGMMGPGNTSGLMALPDTQVVAACDLDSRPLAKAVEAVNKKYGNNDCKAY